MVRVKEEGVRQGGGSLCRKTEFMVRVTKSQYDRILDNAETKGYKTISDYIRNRILGFDLFTEAKIHRIFEVVVQNKDVIQTALDKTKQEPVDE